jgi:hypothetical protein
MMQSNYVKKIKNKSAKQGSMIKEHNYSLRFILLAITMDVPKTKIYIDTSILESTNMDQRE